MTTYVLSQHETTWHVYRYEEGVTNVAVGVPDEESALQLAILEAKAHIPSQVLRVAVNGDSRIVATFE